MDKIRKAVGSIILGLTGTGFFHIFGSSVINKIVQFASSLILVRILSKAEYGVYTYANNILTMCMLFSGLGMTSAVLQLGSETDSAERKQKVYQYGCRFGFIVNLGLAVIILLIAAFIPLPIAGSNTLLGFMCLIPATSLLSEMQRVFLRTDLRNKEFSYANTFSTVVLLTLSCLLAYLLRAKGLILAHYLVSILTVAFIVCLYKVPFTLKKVWLKKDDRSVLIKIGFISASNNGLSRLMYLLDILVLAIVIPDESVIAAYKIATAIPTALIFIPDAVITYAYPFFAKNRQNKNWLRSKYKILMLFLGSANTVISVVLYIIAPWLIVFLFGAQYSDAVAPFRILCVSYFVSGTFRVPSGNLLVTQRKLKFNLIVAIIASALNTVLNVFFITAWGSIGAAIATLVTAIVIGATNTIYLVYVFRDIRERKFYQGGEI